jgi:hypothetical protein
MKGDPTAICRIGSASEITASNGPKRLPLSGGGIRDSNCHPGRSMGAGIFNQVRKRNMITADGGQYEKNFKNSAE